MTKNQRLLFLFSLVSIVAVVCICVAKAQNKLLFSFITSNPQQSVGKSEDRELRHRAWSNEPIQITKVKAKGKMLELGKKILAEDDWLRGLTISLRNVAGKTIVFVDLELHFLRPDKNSLEPITAYPISIGNSLDGGGASSQPSLAPSVRILPGESWDMSLADQDYTSLLDFLKRTRHPGSVKEVEVIVHKVIFDDNTCWAAGRMFRRSPENPDEWLPIQPPQGELRTGVSRNTPSKFFLLKLVQPFHLTRPPRC